MRDKKRVKILCTKPCGKEDIFTNLGVDNRIIIKVKKEGKATPVTGRGGL
jgi:hypothetical protein